MTTTRTQRIWDIVERVVWTVIQGGAAEGIILATGWSQALTVPIMALLAIVKTTLASKFGATSAATLPASLDAAAPGDSGQALAGPGSGAGGTSTTVTYGVPAEAAHPHPEVPTQRTGPVQDVFRDGQL